MKRYLRYRARIRGEQEKRIRRRVEEAMETCAIAGLAGTATELLSAGQRRRVALAEAILLRPRVMLLDDVLSGLDAQSRLSLCNMLSSSISFAAAIVSGHELHELGRFAKRFFVLRDGRLYEAPDAAAAERALR